MYRSGSDVYRSGSDVYRSGSDVCRSGSDTVFYDTCSAVRALRVYLRPRCSLHRTENDNITIATTQMSLPQRYGVFSAMLCLISDLTTFSFTMSPKNDRNKRNRNNHMLFTLKATV